MQDDPREEGAGDSGRQADDRGPDRRLPAPPSFPRLNFSPPVPPPGAELDDDDEGIDDPVHDSARPASAGAPAVPAPSSPPVASAAASGSTPASPAAAESTGGFDLFAWAESEGGDVREVDEHGAVLPPHPSDGEQEHADPEGADPLPFRWGLSPGAQEADASAPDDHPAMRAFDDALATEPISVPAPAVGNATPAAEASEPAAETPARTREAQTVDAADAVDAASTTVDGGPTGRRRQEVPVEHPEFFTQVEPAPTEEMSLPVAPGVATDADRPSEESPATGRAEGEPLQGHGLAALLGYSAPSRAAVPPVNPLWETASIPPIGIDPGTVSASRAARPAEPVRVGSDVDREAVTAEIPVAEPSVEATGEVSSLPHGESEPELEPDAEPDPDADLDGPAEPVASAPEPDSAGPHVDEQPVSETDVRELPDVDLRDEEPAPYDEAAARAAALDISTQLIELPAPAPVLPPTVPWSEPVGPIAEQALDAPTELIGDGQSPVRPRADQQTRAFAPVGTASVAGGTGFAGDDVAAPGSVVASHAGGRRQRVVFLIAIVVAALLVLAGLFAIGTRLPALFGASGATSSAKPSPSASAKPTPTPTPVPTVTPKPGAAQGGGAHPWYTLGGGECVSPFTTAFAESFTVVDCATPHAAQLLYTDVLNPDISAPYPGDQTIQTAIAGLCARPGIINTSVAAQFTDLQIQSGYPANAEQWQAGQRSYYCFAARSSGQPITGTLAGTGPTG